MYPGFGFEESTDRPEEDGEDTPSGFEVIRFRHECLSEVEVEVGRVEEQHRTEERGNTQTADTATADTQKNPRHC